MRLDEDPITGNELSGGNPPAFQAMPIGREPAPVPPAETSPPRRHSRRKWLYVAAIIVLGMVTTEPEAASLSERRGEMFGGGIALLFMSFCFVSVFFVWRTSTRPLIPGAALLTALFMVPLIGAGKAGETKEQFAALQQFVDSTASPADVADAPPRDNDARMLWATRKAVEDLLAHFDALAQSHGVDPDHAPEVWLSAAYLSDARGHPEVKSYFTRFQAYVRSADSTLIPMLTVQMRARLVQSGLASSQIDAFMRGFGRGTARHAERQQLATMLEFAETALELDAYLVRVDSRVHLDERTETALFDREAERQHATELLERIERLGRDVDAGKDRSADRLKEYGRAFGIEADTADAAPAPATASGARKT